ncbi:MFS transporter (plasmid) [Rhizobium sp. CCGE531]|nr:MFS transporter [Rhizobium sp. CCGE531]
MRKIDNAISPKRETLSPVTPVMAETNQKLLDWLPASVLVPYLITAIALALAYGSSFLLVDAMQFAGFQASAAGGIVSAGIIATLIGAIFAGRLAEYTGILPLIAVSSLVMAAAMTSFALVGTGGLAFAYAGGVLLGFGWAVFYTLAPIQLIDRLKPSARLEALTLLSGSQMLGIGGSAPLGHFIADQIGNPSAAYAFYAVFCVVAAVFAMFVQTRLKRQPQLSARAVALSVPTSLSILRGKTVLPVIMMGIGACIFAGLSTFQSIYAASRGLSPNVFFLTFTVTTVALRFSLASMIGKLPLARLALALFVTTLIGIGLLVLNSGSALLYVFASVLFAVGYGLTYSTLNAMVVNLASERGLSISVASQVFALAYFVGSFGFPYFGGLLIAAHGIDVAMLAMAGLVAINIAIISQTLRRPM